VRKKKIAKENTDVNFEVSWGQGIRLRGTVIEFNLAAWERIFSMSI